MSAIYYATAENMLARSDGSNGVDWIEVTVIGRQFMPRDHVKYVLVEALDKSRRFTTREEHLFIKKSDEEAESEDGDES